jgi:hypothetical protein
MPSPSIAKQIIGAFVTRVAALDEVAAAVDRESRDVPAEVRDGPVVVAFWRSCPQVAKETGGGTDVTWEWGIRIYVSLLDFETAQEDFYAVVPAVLGLGNSQALVDDLTALSDGGGTVYAGSLELTDGGSEPHYETDEGWAMKELRLKVQSYQPGTS